MSVCLSVAVCLRGFLCGAFAYVGGVCFYLCGYLFISLFVCICVFVSGMCLYDCVLYMCMCMCLYMRELDVYFSCTYW